MKALTAPLVFLCVPSARDRDSESPTTDIWERYAKQFSTVQARLCCSVVFLPGKHRNIFSSFYLISLGPQLAVSSNFQLANTAATVVSEGRNESFYNSQRNLLSTVASSRKRTWAARGVYTFPFLPCFFLSSFFSVFSVEINPKIVVVNKVKDNLFNRVDWVEKC